MADLFDMSGKVAIVTGGSRGLGREMALAFADHGADVVIASRKLDNCETVADEVRAKGRKALAVAYHAASWSGADDLAKAAFDAFGRVDVLVNNAGMSPLYPSLDAVSEDLYDKVMGVNIKGPFRLTSVIGTRMSEGDGGSIMFVSSVAATRPSVNEAVYGAAKAGLHNLTLSFAHAFGPKVRVNCIVPGAFLTDISKAWDMTQFEKTAKALPLRRGGEPNEIVGAALYFASNASSYTTGSVLRVDGRVVSTTRTPEVDWVDFTSADTYANGHPWTAYARLRAEAPVAWHEEREGPGFWTISRWEDVRTISRQPQRYSSSIGGVMMETPDPMSLAMQRQMMLNMDPPQHDRFKLLVSRGFTPKSAQALVGRVNALAHEIVDDVIARGECDFVTDLAGRLPSGLIAELMGIPRADGERLYELTEIMHTTDLTVAPVERKIAAIGEMLTYALGVAGDKRANPGDDIASTLVQAEVDGERLTDEEFQWFFLLLVNAGGDTTRNLVAAGTQLLFEHPDQHARLAADLDGLMPTAIEEMLRYTTPVIYFRRTLSEDVTLGGVELSEGDKVVMLYGSANRDESVFAEPDRFDVGRSPNPHMAFGGGGPHLCLGMHVARIEIDTLLRQILTRMPDLAPAGPAELMSSNFIAGVHSMPVRWTA